MIYLKDIRVRDEKKDIKESVARILEIKKEYIKEIKILKRSLDFRKKQKTYVYTVEVRLDPGTFYKKDSPYIFIPKKTGYIPPQKVQLKKRPVIVGLGPAGIFCALAFVGAGIKPIILEKGKKIEDREKDVKLLWEKGIFNPESNVLFGEGGAGTFSDGKLFTRKKDPRCQFILEKFVEFGADEKILYLNRPHVGTDKLKEVVRSARNYLIRNGCEIHFGRSMDEIVIRKGKVCGVLAKDLEIEAENVILAIGHSSKDTVYMLYEKGVNFLPKPFAIGARIEHPKRLIDKIQTGKVQEEATYYNLKARVGKRTVYTFCMCPGGSVICASAYPETVCTNGMSNSKRDGNFSNSAIVVSLTLEDFFDGFPLSGMKFQEDIEKKAFSFGGGGYRAPAQNVIDFIKEREPKSVRETTYKPGVYPFCLDRILPEFVVSSIREALLKFDRRMKGFISEDAILIGVETRTSSPYFIERNSYFQVPNIKGLFVIGEGAGYGGGIIGAAIEGLKVVENMSLMFDVS